MSTPTLKVRKLGATTWLTLNRPETLNALTEELVTALAAAIQAASQDARVRAIVIDGAAGNFCSGLDLKATAVDGLTEIQAARALEQFQEVIQGIASAPKPIIAKVQGAAVGFGADLALACDLRVFAASGYLQEKFVDIGLMPDGGGTFWLPRLAGLGKALELLLLGDPIEADAALVHGLAAQVVPDENVDSACRALADRLCAKAPLALAAIKAATRESADQSLNAALKRERTGQVRLLRSADFREGVSAWSERRAPDFRGR